MDTAFFTPSPEAPQRRHLLAVASLSPYKKMDLAIEAAARAGAPLVIVGTGPEARRLAARSTGEVRLEGHVPPEELRRLYREAICFLQPGVEDFGIAAVEALACGTPVVALGQGGVLDVVRDGREGLLFARDDAAEIAAAIDKVRQMQFNFVNLRERAEEFSSARFARRLRELLVSDWPDAERFLT